MIKFLADIKGGGTLVGIGLSAANTTRLLQGQSISIKLNEMMGEDGHGIEVLVFGGETEQDMTNQLKRLITPDTIVHET